MKTNGIWRTWRDFSTFQLTVVDLSERAKFRQTLSLSRSLLFAGWGEKWTHKQTAKRMPKLTSSRWLSVHWTVKSFPFTLGFRFVQECFSFPIFLRFFAGVFFPHWFSSHVDYLQSFQERSYFHFNRLIIKGVKSFDLLMWKSSLMLSIPPTSTSVLITVNRELINHPPISPAKVFHKKDERESKRMRVSVGWGRETILVIMSLLVRRWQAEKA